MIVALVYKTDNHHRNPELIGIALKTGTDSVRFNAVAIVREKAGQEGHILDDEQANMLEGWNQTQGYAGYGEFLIEYFDYHEVNTVLE